MLDKFNIYLDDIKKTGLNKPEHEIMEEMLSLAKEKGLSIQQTYNILVHGAFYTMFKGINQSFLNQDVLG